MQLGASNYSLGYRLDIQGIRAIAVLLVILCHANVPGFGGGFVGVDVFFVLSGYLISGLLIQEFSDTGRIDFGRFYLRRLQRLAPALFVMLLLTSAAMQFVVTPSEQGQHYLSGAMAALWMSNIHFSFSEMEYFSATSAENAFLHTWSLSVEEQFYLLWPVLVFVILSLSKRRTRQFAGKRIFLSFLSILALSFAFCLYLTYTHGLAAYYLPVARAWQFAAGAIALLVTFRLRNGFTAISRVPRKSESIVVDAIGWAGLAILVVSVIAISEKLRYPGVWAVAPTLGTTLLLIAGGSSGPRGVAQVLAQQPLVRIGNVSYGWYLWHWPVLVLAKILFPASTVAITGAALAVSCILAVLSYHLIEEPVRLNRYLASRPRLFGAMVVSAMAVVVAAQLEMMRASQVDVWSPELDEVYSARNDLPRIYAMECDDWIDSADLRKCEFGSESPSHEAILIGDSIAGQWFSVFSTIALRPEWRFTVYTKSACPLLDAPVYYARIGRRFKNCEIWRENLLSEIAARQPDILLMGSSHNYAYSSTEWENGTARILRKLADHAEQVVLLRSTPSLPFDLLSCAGNRIWQQLKLPVTGLSDCSLASRDRDGERVYQALRSAAASYGNVKTVDLNSLVCPDGRCSATHGDTFVFRDTQHLTDSFVKSIAPQALKFAGIERFGVQDAAGDEESDT